MLIVHLVVAGIFLVLGTVFAFGKGSFLIAGYKPHPQKKRRSTTKRSSVGLCRSLCLR